MTADVSGSSSEAPPARPSAGARVAVAACGVAVVIVGGLLLFNPFAAARTLALLIGLALLVGGAIEVGVAWDSPRRATAILPGVILVVGGLLTAVWPGATLWTLAVVTGLSLLLHGIGRTALAFLGRSEITGWGWLVLAGAFNILVGIAVLVWPEATVLVLSLIFGFQILCFGLLLLAAAFSGSRMRA